MGDLKKHLEGVNESESPAEEEVVEPKEEGSEEEPKKEGQTFEQFKREMQRKFNKVSDVVKRIDESLQNISRQPVQPAPKQADSMDAMSLAELRQLRQSDQVPEELRGQLDDYYYARLAKEESRAVGQDLREELRLQKQADDARRTAVSRYPDLLDETSDFFGLVERALQGYDDVYLARNPQTLLNVANEIAIKHNVLPNRRKPLTKPANRHNETPDETTPEEEFDMEKHSKISKALKHALPNGKEFNVENIKERKKFYRENREYMRKV